MSTLGRRGNRNLKYSDTATGKHIVTVRGATYHRVCAQASYSKDILRGDTTRPQAPTDLATLSTASSQMGKVSKKQYHEKPGKGKPFLPRSRRQHLFLLKLSLTLNCPYRTLTL